MSCDTLVGTISEILPFPTTAEIDESEDAVETLIVFDVENNLKKYPELCTCWLNGPLPSFWKEGNEALVNYEIVNKNNQEERWIKSIKRKIEY